MYSCPYGPKAQATTDRQTFQICSRRGGWRGDWCVERARRPAPEGRLWRMAHPAVTPPRTPPWEDSSFQSITLRATWRQCAFTQGLIKVGGKGKLRESLRTTRQTQQHHARPWSSMQSPGGTCHKCFAHFLHMYPAVSVRTCLAWEWKGRKGKRTPAWRENL